MYNRKLLHFQRLRISNTLLQDLEQHVRGVHEERPVRIRRDLLRKQYMLVELY